MSEQFHTVGVNLGADSGIDGGKNGGEGRGKDRSYAITIGRGLLVDSHLWSEIIGSRGVVLVTDDQVGPLYAERLQSALPTLDRFTHITLPAGEQQKSMASVQQILDAALADRDITTAFQKPQLGTAHAALQAREELAGFTGNILVCFGDCPMVKAATVRKLVAALDDGAKVAVLGFRPNDPLQYGRIIADRDGRVAKMATTRNPT